MRRLLDLLLTPVAMDRIEWSSQTVQLIRVAQACCETLRDLVIAPMFVMPPSIPFVDTPTKKFTEAVQVVALTCMSFDSASAERRVLGFTVAQSVKQCLMQTILWCRLTMQLFAESQATQVMSRTLWLVGLCFLTLCFHFEHHQWWFRSWKTRLLAARVTPSKYTWQRFCSPRVVYIKLSTVSSLFYVGCTQKGITARECSRLRKIKQINAGKLVQAEVAARWWASKENYFEFFPIVFRVCGNFRTSTIWETHYILAWQAPLNMPYIAKLMKETEASKTKQLQYRCKYTRPKKFRLWRKVRKLAKKSKQTMYPFARSTPCGHAREFHFQSCTVLQHLATRSLKKFQAEKRLRSWKISPEQLYALHRQAQSLTEPERGRVIKALKNIFQYRGLTIPRHPMTLTWWPLAHESFLPSTKSWMSKTIVANRTKFLPFHCPPKSLVEGKHKSIELLLHNYKTLQKSWTLQPPKGCPCAGLIAFHQGTVTHQGHVMAKGEEIPGLPSDVANVLQANAKDSVFPSKLNYLRHTCSSINSWSDHHQGPPLNEAWTQLIEEHWPLHLEAVQQRGSYSFDSIAHTRQVLDGFVLHIEDHCPGQTRVFCPQVYFRLIEATFFDDVVFEPLAGSSAQVRSCLLEFLPKDFRSKYSWGINEAAELPYSYIFPKRKKKWTTARPIIAFSGSVFATLLKAIATLLTSLTKLVFPETFHFRDVFETFHDLKQFFKFHGHRFQSDRYSMDNDDLSGFFTSIPQDRIEMAIDIFLMEYLDKQRTKDIRSLTFTVLDNKGTTDGRVIRGKARTETASHLIWFTDVADLVKYSLQLGCFTSLGRVFKQRRGSCMGSPISPVLCSLTVTVDEALWQKSFCTLLQSNAFITRYVDNRLIIASAAARQHRALQQFVQLEFYRPPVCLEVVGGNTLLGFEVNLERCTISYKVPTCDSQFRSTKSAGTHRLILSGLSSRLHIICKCAYPRSEVYKGIKALIDQYRSRGFNPKLLNTIISRTAKKFGLLAKLPELLQNTLVFLHAPVITPRHLCRRS